MKRYDHASLQDDEKDEGTSGGHIFLTELQSAQASRGIIDIVGDVKEDMAMYVRHALAIVEMQGLKEIEVRISSRGGSALYGLMIHDMIAGFNGDSVGVVIGEACSAAALILQACNVRLAHRHAEILIHNPNVTRTMSIGELTEGKELTKLRESLLKWKRKADDILRKSTGRTLREIREQCLKNARVDAEEALAFGLIDDIV